MWAFGGHDVFLVERTNNATSLTFSDTKTHSYLSARDFSSRE
jgi:hypothetical protein